MGEFIRRTLSATLRGSRAYWAWLAFLTAWLLVGAWCWGSQLSRGLQVTHLTDEVVWGVYIANFTFLVGTAAAAVMLVIPSYVYRDGAMRQVLVFGELMAIASVLMCLLFLLVDLGRPDRFWHALPLVGRFHFPASLMAWDVLALGGYLFVNVGLATKLLYDRFHGRAVAAAEPSPPTALTWVVIVWAIAIHTITAFLYSGLGGRPHWNVGILAPNFIATAFASGTALMIVALRIVSQRTGLDVPAAALERLRQIAVVCLWVSLFLLGSELFSVLYAGTDHAAAERYRFVGLGGHGGLVPYTWAGVALVVGGAVILSLPRCARRTGWLVGGCVAAVLGLWLGKGMGLIVPGLVPTTLGETIDYQPSLVELGISAGIWAFGALIFTMSAKVAAAILSGSLRASAPGVSASPAATGEGQEAGA